MQLHCGPGIHALYMSAMYGIMRDNTEVRIKALAEDPNHAWTSGM